MCSLMLPVSGATTKLLSWKQTQPELGPDIIKRLLLETDAGSDTVDLRLTDADVQRYEVPKWLLRPSGWCPSCCQC